MKAGTIMAFATGVLVVLFAVLLVNLVQESREREDFGAQESP